MIMRKAAFGKRHLVRSKSRLAIDKKQVDNEKLECGKLQKSWWTKLPDYLAIRSLEY